MAQPHWRGRKYLDQEISREPQHSHQNFFDINPKVKAVIASLKLRKCCSMGSPLRRIRDSIGKAGDASSIGFYSLHVPHVPLLSSCHKSVSITIRCLYSSDLLNSIIIHYQLLKIRPHFEHNISNPPDSNADFTSHTPWLSIPISIDSSFPPLTAPCLAAAPAAATYSTRHCMLTRNCAHSSQPTPTSPSNKLQAALRDFYP